MKLKITLLAFSVTLLFSSGVFGGGPPGFSPFSSKATPKLFPLEELKMLEHAVFGIPANGTRPPVEVLEFIEDDNGTNVEVFASGKTGFTGRFHVSGMYSWQTAYLADFNKDGKNDLAIEISSGGNGTAACIADVTFLLSGSPHPKPLIVGTRCPRRDDFVDLGGNGQCQFVQTCFVEGYGELGKDGRRHNYWVYNLVRIQSDRVVLDNSILPGFPKWVMYTFKPNTRATDQLTDGQKARLWQQELRYGSNDVGWCERARGQ